MFFQIKKIVENEDDTWRLLEDLEFEHELPMWFWSKREWLYYTMERRRLTWLLKEELSSKML